MPPSPSPSPGGAAHLSSLLFLLLGGATLLLGACGQGDPSDDRHAAERDGAASGIASSAVDHLAEAEQPESRPDVRGTTGAGRWRIADPDGEDTTPIEDETLEQLRAIGYAAGSQSAPTHSGVTIHDTARAEAGLNFVLSAHRAEAVLMDMDGKVLHSWHKPLDDIWDYHPRDDGQASADFWRRAHLFPNGDLLAVFDGLGLVKLDKDSNIRWSRPYPAHHDLDISPNGNIWVLTREVHALPRVAARIPGMGSSDDTLSSNILEDFVTCLSPDGVRKLHVSLIDCFERGAPELRWPAASREFWKQEPERDFEGRPADVFHANSITLLEGRAEDRNPAFRAGNLLVSARHLDMVAVVDPRTWTAVWSMTGETALQHDPSITREGNLLVYDNQWQPGRSRVVVFDPLTQAVVWEYGTTDDQPLYSETCGAAQELRNGSILITESDSGRALEVTPEGDIVWEFVNPQRAGDQDQYIATLFDVVRLPAAFGADWLKSDG